MASQSFSSPSTSSSSSASTSSSTPRSPTSPRLVRFEDKCTLIPECSPKSPRIMTKSYSLPIVHLQLPWKRSAPVAVANESIPERHIEPSSTTDHLVVKLPIPTFRRTSRSPIRDAESHALPPCLVHRQEHSFPPLCSSLSLLRTPSSPPSESTSKPRGRPVRSTSLPTPPSNAETIPLRPCCTNCFAACTSLPPLFESSQEDSHVHDNSNSTGTAEDWCEGMHFTKGALRRRRSASMEGEGFHAALLRVDEVDRKSRTTKSADCIAPNLVHLKIKVSSDDRSVVSSKSDDSELFPLPSPKRTPTGSPSPSPSASAQNLTALFPHEPGKLETAIREKIAHRAREQEAASGLLTLDPGRFSSGTATPPVLVPGRPSQVRPVVSHFHSHVDEIEYDRSLPDPDALPLSSTILLNSPPSSPFVPASPTMPSKGTSLSLAGSPSTSPGAHISSRRRPSLSVVSIVQAGVGVLRGISMSTNSSIAV